MDLSHNTDWMAVLFRVLAEEGGRQPAQAALNSYLSLTFLHTGMVYYTRAWWRYGVEWPGSGEEQT